MVRNELNFLRKNKLLVVVMAVILLIPAIYAGMFLSSMWDPYGDISKLPVAVVNQDVSVDYQDKTLSVGDSLETSLENSDAMDFHVTDEVTAENGLKNGTYYMVITIPEDFSENASTMMDANPKKMKLQYATNPGYNYISSKLSESAIKEIKANIMAEVTETYTKAVFASIAEMGDGFSNAADGTGELLSGMNTLNDGAATLTDNLGVLASSSTALQEGSAALENGVEAYLDGVAKVDGGLHTLSGGMDALADGTNQLLSGSQTLLTGVNTMKNQIDNSLTNEKVAQIKTASSSLLAMNDSIQKLNAAVNGDGTEANKGIGAAGSAEQMAALQAMVQQLAAASSQLLPASSNAMDSLLSGMQNVQKGLGQTMQADGQAGILEGVSQLNAGIESLNAGIAGESGLQSGVQELKAGSAQLVEKGNELKTGAGQLSDGTAQLSDGADALAKGSADLQDGITSLMDGTTTLDMALMDGADQVAGNAVTDTNIDMFVTPLTAEETQVTSVENNGHAMAAYMMSVGLWVGCLAFCLMYPLVEYHEKLNNGLAWFASKAVIVYPTAIIMGIVLYFILHLVNGFQPVQTGKTILVSVIAAICFMSIMYFFNAMLGKVGSFFMLVFMVLQLAGSAGTYPIEISGSFAASIHKYVPFTYTVTAFRSAISGGAGIGRELGVLIALTVIFTLLTAVLFWYRANRIKAGKTILYTWIEEHTMGA